MEQQINLVGKTDQQAVALADQHLGGAVDGLVRSMQKHAAAVKIDRS